MLRRARPILFATGVLGVALLAASASTTPTVPGLELGAAELSSAGALAFGPDGILFVGDSLGAAVYALDVGAGTADTTTEPLRLENVDRVLAGALGIAAEDLLIRDMAVQPGTQVTYLSLSRGRGDDAVPVIARLTRGGEVETLDLKEIRHAKVDVAGAPAVDAKDRRGRPLRTQTVTDLAYRDGRLFVAGLSNEEFASTLRTYAFPFQGEATSSGLEVYHGAHGRYETHAPIRTFLPHDLGGKPHLLAAYTCTPLVTFPVAAVAAGGKVKGKTVAELGYGSSPLDMIALGDEHILITNSRRTAMKVRVADIAGAASLSAPVERTQMTAGTPYLAMPMVGVLQLDHLNDEHVMLLQRSADDGSLNLRSHPKAWL